MQQVGPGPGEGDGGDAESCVLDAGGAAVAAVVESFAGSLGGEAGALLLLLFSLSRVRIPFLIIFTSSISTPYRTRVCIPTPL